MLFTQFPSFCRRRAGRRGLDMIPTGYVINHHGSGWVTDVTGNEAAEALLSRRVPELEPDLWPTTATSGGERAHDVTQPWGWRWGRRQKWNLKWLWNWKPWSRQENKTNGATWNGTNANKTAKWMNYDVNVTWQHGSNMLFLLTAVSFRNHTYHDTQCFGGSHTWILHRKMGLRFVLGKKTRSWFILYDPPGTWFSIRSRCQLLPAKQTFHRIM